MAGEKVEGERPMKLFSTLLAWRSRFPQLHRHRQSTPGTISPATLALSCIRTCSKGGNRCSGATVAARWPNLNARAAWRPQSRPWHCTSPRPIRRFGEVGRAESVLREQIKRTPGDARLLPALDALRVEMPPPAPPAAASACTDRVGVSCRQVPPSTDRAASGRSSAASSSTGNVAAAPVASRRERAPDADSVPPSPPASVQQSADGAQFGAGFALALQEHRFDDAQRQADAWLAHEASGAALLDELTYQLVTAGATEQAMRVLLRSLPVRGPRAC